MMHELIVLLYNKSSGIINRYEETVRDDIYVVYVYRILCHDNFFMMHVELAYLRLRCFL